VTLFPNSAMFHENRHRIPSWERYFESLSDVKFEKDLFFNLTDMPASRLQRLRRWAVAEAYFPNLSNEWPAFVMRVLRLMVRWRLIGPEAPFKGLERRMRALNRWLRGASRADVPLQIPPHHAGQAVMREGDGDGYEESLAELRRELVLERQARMGISS
jgi:hypothetical protein